MVQCTAKTKTGKPAFLLIAQATARPFGNPYEANEQLDPPEINGASTCPVMGTARIKDAKPCTALHCRIIITKE